MGKIVETVEGIVFRADRSRLVALLAAIALPRTGIGAMPNSGLSLRIAEDPFANPITDPATHYLMWSWLGPLLGSALGATSAASYFALHLAFSCAFVATASWLVMADAPERNARVALVLFFLLPASTTSFYWVGMDSLTLLLVALALVLRARPIGAFVVGVLLGMQHFEQGLVAAAALTCAVALLRGTRSPAWVSLPWCAAWAGGIVAGKLALAAAFHHLEIDVATDRADWAARLLPDLARQLVGNFHAMVWSILGVGWVVVVRYAEKGALGWRLVALLGAASGVLLLAFDQTRVAAIVTFPVFFVTVLRDQAFLRELPERFVAWLVVGWVLTPWIWVIGGEPELSRLPHDVAFFVARVAGREVGVESPFSY